MFDIAQEKMSELEEAEIVINTKTGEPTEVKIRVLSPDSDKFRRVNNRIRNNALKFVRKNNGTTAERIEADQIELLVKVTTGWSGIAENGQPLPFTEENVRKLYTGFPFIREQVDDFVGDRKNFINA